MAIILFMNSRMLVKILFVGFSDQQASARNDQITELNCFLHYYSRFKNHENSYKVNCFFFWCVAPENIHPPSTKGIGFCNTQGWGILEKISFVGKEWIFFWTGRKMWDERGAEGGGVGYKDWPRVRGKANKWRWKCTVKFCQQVVGLCLFNLYLFW